jgi:hypothetical protein
VIKRLYRNVSDFDYVVEIKAIEYVFELFFWDLVTTDMRLHLISHFFQAAFKHKLVVFFGSLDGNHVVHFPDAKVCAELVAS